MAAIAPPKWASTQAVRLIHSGRVHLVTANLIITGNYKLFSRAKKVYYFRDIHV